MDISKMTAVGLGQAIRKKEVSVREALAAVLRVIDEKEDRIHAYISLQDRELLCQRADEIQKKMDDGTLTGPLAGVPVAVKDNICLEGLPTTCASRILENFHPVYTASAAQALTEAGALILGKTNMDEFAMGSTTETSAFGITRNPAHTDHVPGGSSGGSAAAVASGEAFAALGSDTGGSIRQPASYCGVVGIKPTYGCVSRYGLVAYGSSLDQIGPLAKDVTDAAALLSVIVRHDERDSTSLSVKDTDYMSALTEDVKDLRIGLPEEYFGQGLDSQVKEAVLAAAEVFRSAGAKIIPLHLNYVDYAVPCYYTIADAEASSNLERFDGVKYGYRSARSEDLHSMYKKTRSEGFGEEVKRRIMLGSFVLSSGYYDAYYLKALKVRALIKGAFDKAFEKADLILGPTAPSTAPLIGESLSDPMKMYLSDIYTVPANLAGLPGISLPCGCDSSGLPIGMQLMGPAFSEKTLIRAAYTWERAAGKEAEHVTDL